MKTFRLLLTFTAVLATAFLSAQTATTVNPDTVCMGVTAEEYYVDKTAGSTYSWSLSGGGMIASSSDTLILVDWDNTPGMDSVYVVETNTYGCVGDTIKLAVVRVAPPVADAGIDVDICQGSSVTLDGSGSTGSNLSYSWSSPAGFTSTQVNPSVTPNATTTYTLTVTDQYGCSSTSTVTVTVISNAVADAGADDTVCEGNSYTLAGSAINQTSVVWNTSGDGNFANGTTLTPVYTPGPNDIANGTVTLTLTASAPGSCPPDIDDVVITIHPKPTTSPIHHY